MSCTRCDPTTFGPADRVEQPCADCEPRVWDMFAAGSTSVERGGRHWYAFGDAGYIRLYDCGPAIPVRVFEDPEGDHLGWLEPEEDEPTMIQHERIFDIQFPYGSAAEVQAGRGSVVRLRIEEK